MNLKEVMAVFPQNTIFFETLCIYAKNSVNFCNMKCCGQDILIKKADDSFFTLHQTWLSLDVSNLATSSIIYSAFLGMNMLMNLMKL